jgi:hypothetical protein
MREILIAALTTGVLAGTVAAQAPTRKPGPEQNPHRILRSAVDL